jgi:hypothetical protein
LSILVSILDDDPDPFPAPAPAPAPAPVDPFPNEPTSGDEGGPDSNSEPNGQEFSPAFDTPGPDRSDVGVDRSEFAGLGGQQTSGENRLSLSDLVQRSSQPNSSDDASSGTGRGSDIYDRTDTTGKGGFSNGDGSKGSNVRSNPLTQTAQRSVSLREGPSKQIGIGGSFTSGPAIGVGVLVSSQVTTSFGTGGSLNSAQAFIGFGLGAVVPASTPFQSISFEVALSQNAPKLGFNGCVPSLMFVTPIFNIQLTGFSEETRLPDTISLSLSFAPGAGIFGGVACPVSLP